MEEHQKELSKILGLNSDERYNTKIATWTEIYVAIGKLKEQADKPAEIRYFPSTLVQPLMDNNPNKHYHNGMPCYNNPCVWA